MKEHKNHPKSNQGHCLFCSTKSPHTFVDLGMSPPCESYRKPEQQNEMEPFYPFACLCL